jgi:hypothetical protein
MDTFKLKMAETRQKFLTHWSLIPDAAKWGVGIVLMLFIVSTIAKCAVNSSNSKALLTDQTSQSIKDMVANAKRWAETAQQDKNPLYALTHINYSINSLEGARRLVPDNVLEKATQTNIVALAASLQTLQNELYQKLQTTTDQSDTPTNIGWY